MRRLFLAVLALAITPVLAMAAGGGNGYYDWQWSFSNTDPDMNSSPPAPGLATLYLWYTGCNSAAAQPGMSAAEMDVFVTEDFAIIAPLSVQNGFLNAGTSNEKLLLVVGGCPTGPLVAGSYLVNVTGAGNGTLGMGPSADNDFALVVDCDNPNAGWDWPQFVRYQGAGTTGATAPIQNHGNGCSAVSVDAESWGGVKSLYR